MNSQRATLFRQWATRVLNEYIRKGFVLDDDRLKQGNAVFGQDYFRELLESSLNPSQRTANLATDNRYFMPNAASITTVLPQQQKEFYAMVQNRFHYAITGHTAAEIIHAGADHTKTSHMGLTTWKYAPDGRILKSDVSIAKNYLSEKEIRSLERTVTSYFDYIESQIERGNVFNMEQFAASVNKFFDLQRL